MSEFNYDSSFEPFATIGETDKFADMNKGIQPIFFTESVEDGAATAEAGTLKTREVEYVMLRVAGDQNSAPVHPVDDALRKRFGTEYKHWMATRKNDHVNGLRITQWPLASKGFAMELAALGIRSVEDLSVVSDVNAMKITNGREWRERARAWLETNKDAAAAARFAGEAERAKAESADLRAQLHEMANRVQALEAAKELGEPMPKRQTRAA